MEAAQSARGTRQVRIRDSETICQKMEHRAWGKCVFHCPYCGQHIITNADIQQPVGPGSQVYTVTFQHQCQEVSDSVAQEGET